MPDPRAELGRIAERAAADYLDTQGYTIIETNFRKRAGEIDIIARKGKRIHFIEIKSQSGASDFPAAESWGDAQRNRFMELAEEYLAIYIREQGTPDLDVSLDFMTVVFGDDGSVTDIDFIEDAIRPGS